MSTLRELKGRIGSVSSSEKITGAMKMISSAKMHKAEMNLGRIVPFRTQIQTIMGNLVAADADFSSPLTESRNVSSVALVIIGSDDGLCGAYNINLFKDLLARINQLKGENSDVKIKVYPVGKKMLKAASKLKIEGVTVADAELESSADSAKVKEFTFALRDAFVAGEVDKVEIITMKYFSAGKQRLQIYNLLPVASEAFDLPADANKPYLFEPNADKIYNSILPLFIISVAQEAFLQNAASEQAARVMAMQAANDNAGKLLDSLKLEFNKLRQQSITTELLDILGGQVDR